MNQVTFTADELSNTKPYLEVVTTAADARCPVAGGRDYPLSTADRAENNPFFQARAVWQVREDEEDQRFYVPDLLSGKDYDADRQAYAAAREYAVHLQKAEGLVCQAEDLVGLMLAAIGDECDARAMQSYAALKVIEETLRKAHRCVNKHDRRHANLFLAYFDLKEQIGRKHGVDSTVQRAI